METTEKKTALKEQQWLDGFKAGVIAEKRKRNVSGCCCVFSDDDTKVTKLCEEHKKMINEIITEMLVEVDKLDGENKRREKKCNRKIISDTIDF